MGTLILEISWGGGPYRCEYAHMHTLSTEPPLPQKKKKNSGWSPASPCRVGCGWL